jgi:methionyl-tRNA formyltransferase
VFQPVRLRSPEALANLAALSPDLIVVAAYAHILPRAILDLPRYGGVNVHASLLPRYRGASPIQAAILDGVAETGVTIMRMSVGLDDGPILAQITVPIDPADSAESLTDKLAVAGAHLLTNTVKGWIAGTITPEPQDGSQATTTQLLMKEHGLIDWSGPASLIERQVRAMYPWPGAYTVLKAGTLKVLHAKVLVAEPESPVPGTVISTAEGPAVATGDGLVLLQTVQPAGKRPMTGSDWLRGAPHLTGSLLGTMEPLM